VSGVHIRRHSQRVIVAIAAIACAGAMVLPVSAHPADEINERDIVRVRPDGIEIAMMISAGSITYLTIWKDADTSGDHELSIDEREAYGRLLGRQYAVAIDGVPTPVHYAANSLQMATTLRAFTLAGADPAGATVLATFTVPCDMSTAHEVTLAVNHYPPSLDGKAPEVIAETAPPLSVVVQGGGDVDLRMTVAEGVSIPAVPTLSPPTRPNSVGVSRLIDVLGITERGPAFALVGLLIAAAFGALHALTPGHGKTLVTAYLVGGNARIRDAFALGGIVTLTHTSSVFAIGVVTLVIARAWTPYQILPWLELTTSVGIIVLGLALARDRFSLARIENGRPRRSTSPARSSTLHEHEDGTVHAHRWFGAHGHSHQVHGARSPRALVLIGISGGMLPCPDALAILLFAVAAGHVLIGLLIILSFSAGLALVLIGLGVLVTTTGVVERIAGRVGGAPLLGRWIPTCSALMMVAAGAAALARALAAIV
jgi:nickel/cobalt exporter